jgi:hypothetical protein
MVEINVEIKPFCAKPGPYLRSLDGLPSVHLRVMFHVKHSRLTQAEDANLVKNARYVSRETFACRGTITESSRPYNYRASVHNTPLLSVIAAINLLYMAIFLQ